MKGEGRQRYLDREFLRDWLIQICPQLPVGLERIRRIKSGVSFGFVGFPKELLGQLFDNGFSFWGFHREPWEDLISDIDILIKKSSEGYSCGYCHDKKFYGSPEELWDEHQLPLFKDFITNELLTAKWLVYLRG